MAMPRLNVYYPEVFNMQDTVVQQKINSTILNLVNTVIKDQEYYKNPRTEIYGSYEIKTNEKGILSLTLFNDAYSGGVHGFDIIRALTMDIQTGRAYTLKDLFKEGTDYVRVLSAIVGKQIGDRGIYLLGPFNSIRPDQDFYIADRSLVIYFQLYEIAPYSAGFLYFPISVYEIKNIIDLKGPLGGFLF
jgi:Protein of unknown function (DUF3298).